MVIVLFVVLGPVVPVPHVLHVLHRIVQELLLLLTLLDNNFYIIRLIALFIFYLIKASLRRLRLNHKKFDFFLFVLRYGTGYAYKIEPAKYTH